MSTKIAINGFGRIGRAFVRASENMNKDFDIVAINDITDAKTLAMLLKYDSVQGRFPGSVEIDNDSLVVNEKSVRVFSERDPEKLPWADLGVDVLIESTGVFRKRDLIAGHLRAGAKRVILTVPAKDKIDATIVLGVNDSDLHADDEIISNASCTTNCAAPMAKVVHDSFGIKQGFLLTIHAYTMDQKLLDAPHKDLRRARAAAQSVIPTTTGAAKAIGKVIPDLDGKMGGVAYRVPTPDGSLVELVLETEKAASVEDINAAMKKAAETDLKGIMKYTDDPIVSSDVIGEPFSVTFDSLMTMVLPDGMIKVSGWYDNEYGYTCRVVDLVDRVVSLM